MIYRLTEPMKAAHLYAGWDESMIWSCLQGVMGSIYADDEDHPQSSAAVLADFVFFTGKPNDEMIQYDYGKDFLIMTAQGEEWNRRIEQCFGDRAETIVRYAIKKEPGTFDKDHLEKLVRKVPEGMILKKIDEDVYNWARQDAWAKSWVESYPVYEMYARWGLGYCLLKDGEPISGASSYTSYDGGIEVQIDTRKEYRKQGLAAICGAALILECLKRGWYPSWDAANMASVRLAEKLGYHFAHTYMAWEVKRK